MSDDAFEQAVARDLEQLVRDRRSFLIELSPAQAFMLLAQLQLALRHRNNDGAAAAFARDFARSLQQRISVSPALAKLCERGWTDD